MRNLILKMSVSLDGFVAGPGGETDWMFGKSDAAAIAWVVDQISNASAHLMGRKTFEVMAPYWPSSTQPFAPPMNDIPKIVFSRAGFRPAPTSSTSWAEARVLTGDMAHEVTGLKEVAGKNLVAHGGAVFAQNLVETGLIDEYRLVVYPIALGRGLPLFSKLKKPLNLQLESSRTFESGVMGNIYRVVRG